MDGIYKSSTWHLQDLQRRLFRHNRQPAASYEIIIILE